MISVVETKDCELLAKLNEEIQTFHHSIQPNIFKPYDKKTINTYFKSTLNSENAIAYIAKENEVTVGYAILFIIKFEDNPFQYARSFVLIDQIIVLKKYQGKGIGKLLLDTAFSFAKKHQIGLVELNHWTLNESARIFFKKNKFEYYNEKMWRALEE